MFKTPVKEKKQQMNDMGSILSNSENLPEKQFQVTNSGDKPLPFTSEILGWFICLLPLLHFWMGTSRCFCFVLFFDSTVLLLHNSFSWWNAIPPSLFCFSAVFSLTKTSYWPSFVERTTDSVTKFKWCLCAFNFFVKRWWKHKQYTWPVICNYTN